MGSPSPAPLRRSISSIRAGIPAAGTLVAWGLAWVHIWSSIIARIPQCCRQRSGIDQPRPPFPPGRRRPLCPIGGKHHRYGPVLLVIRPRAPACASPGARASPSVARSMAGAFLCGIGDTSTLYTRYIRAPLSASLPPCTPLFIPPSCLRLLVGSPHTCSSLLGCILYPSSAITRRAALPAAAARCCRPPAAAHRPLPSIPSLSANWYPGVSPHRYRSKFAPGRGAKERRKGANSKAFGGVVRIFRVKAGITAGAAISSWSCVAGLERVPCTLGAGTTEQVSHEPPGCCLVRLHCAFFRRNTRPAGYFPTRAARRFNGCIGCADTRPRPVTVERVLLVAERHRRGPYASPIAWDVLSAPRIIAVCRSDEAARCCRGAGALIAKRYRRGSYTSPGATRDVRSPVVDARTTPRNNAPTMSWCAAGTRPRGRAWLRGTVPRAAPRGVAWMSRSLQRRLRLDLDVRAGEYMVVRSFQRSKLLLTFATYVITDQKTEKGEPKQDKKVYHVLVDRLRILDRGNAEPWNPPVPAMPELTSAGDEEVSAIGIGHLAEQVEHPVNLWRNIT
ncbi:hypothetical protein B0H11DRAFT_2241109 [Mycena galericulata]|nr:hypothetical protein B0H11DRAFT_2241109 [Mycena galericulata]